MKLIIKNNRIYNPRNQHRRALSLVEMLVSLAITAMLLTATAVAIDTSFKAYASAAESASTQAATRMVINRLLTLVRTSIAHGPLTLNEAYNLDTSATMANNTIASNYIEMLDTKGRLVRIQFSKKTETLTLRIDVNNNFAFETNEIAQPLLGGVKKAIFHVKRRRDNEGVYVLERGTLDLTVAPDRDNTLSIETANREQIRVIASTMPRRLED